MSSPKVLERRVFYAGDRIFREGSYGNCAFIVEGGTVSIRKRTGKRGADGDFEETVLGHVTKGGIFGEMALIDDEPRMAAAYADVQTSVIIVPRRVFEERLADVDPFIRGLLNIFAKHIREMVRKNISQANYLREFTDGETAASVAPSAPPNQQRHATSVEDGRREDSEGNV